MCLVRAVLFGYSMAAAQSYRVSSKSLVVLSALLIGACQTVLDLDTYHSELSEPPVATTPPRYCTKDTECATQDAGTTADRRICSRKTAECVSLLTPECGSLEGPLDDPRALRLGTLLDPSKAGRSQQQSAQLAVAELNDAGGIALFGASPRPLALIACDARSLPTAAAHLIGDLGVLAIVGPSSNEDSVELALSHSIASGVLTISPTATAASLGDLLDADLSWTMLPTDEQRAALLGAELAELERELGMARGAQTLKLSVVLRDAAGARTSLDTLRWQDQTLGAKTNLGSHVMLHEYNAPSASQASVVDALVRFAPDVVLLYGGAETVTSLLQALEPSFAGRAQSTRPHYLLGEAAPTPELLALAAGSPGLEARVRGLRAMPVAAAEPVLDAFAQRYLERFGADPRALTGAGEAYDAIYAIAYGLSASGAAQASGRAAASGLRKLSGGTMPVTTGSRDIAQSLRALAQAGALDLMGTLDRLTWNAQGLRQGGRLEVWCASDDRRVRSSASYDVGTATLSMPEHSCGAPPSGAGSGLASGPSPAAASGGGAQQQAASTPMLTPDAGSPEPEVRVGSAAQDEGLVAQYSAMNRDPHDSVISPGLRILNRSGSQPIALAGLELRYYFSNEHAELCPAGCAVDGSYAGVQPSGQSVFAQRSYVPQPDGAYLSVRFALNLTTLARGEYVEVQQQIHTNPYTDLDETNDYSFDATRTSYVDWPRVSIYRDGVLVWGEPPP